MAPTPVSEPFHRQGWIDEEKVDGWRIVACKDGERVRVVRQPDLMGPGRTPVSRTVALLMFTAASVFPGAAVAQQSPTTAALLNCTVIRRSTSAYYYREKIWSGEDPLFKTRPLPVFKEQRSDEIELQPTSYIFSVNAKDVIVKQLYRDGKGGQELAGQVLHRLNNSTLIIWPLPLSAEARLALINHKEKKAVISQMGAGIVGLGVTAMITECE
jgi:hypothetical protein